MTGNVSNNWKLNILVSFLLMYRYLNVEASNICLGSFHLLLFAARQINYEIQFIRIINIIINDKLGKKVWYDMVQDQRSISVSTEPIFDISLGSISHTFSCIFYLWEFIFFNFHAKLVIGRSFTDFPIVTPCPSNVFTTGTVKKLM